MPPERTYLDHNATAPLLPQVRDAVIAALDVHANPSSVHADGRAARRLVDEARRLVAALTASRPDHVVFTSGATEAASLLLTPAWTMGRSPLRLSRLYVTSTEHPCIGCGGRFAEDDVVVIPVDSNGIVRLDALEEALRLHDRTAGLPLVALHAAHNETGVIQPWRDAARIARGAGAMVVVDAVQAAGRLPLDFADGAVDFLILSSHKLGGPKGAGAVVAGSDLAWPAPLVRGGGQEKGHRAGTENVAAIAGFGVACRHAVDSLGRMDDVAAMRDRFEAAVLAAVPDAVVYGSAVRRLPNTLFFGVPGLKAETTQIAFDLEGVAVSAGSACSSGKVGPSATLRAMGVLSPEGALRVSIAPTTGEADLARFAAALGKIVSRRARPGEARAA